ncbi:MAG TPA: hypothetical protein DHW82_00245 [Spirochaetia bacterium]|nr:hypothetical protein [Spirochaetia bacterium]
MVLLLLCFMIAPNMTLIHTPQLFLSFFSSSDTPFSILVDEKLIEDPNPCSLTDTSFQKVFIKDSFFYFPEKGRWGLKEYQGKSGFSVFFIRDGKLSRNFYFLKEKKITESGFYALDFKIINSKKESNACIYEIEDQKLEKIDFDLEQVEKRLFDQLEIKSYLLSETSLKVLQAKNPKSILLTLNEEYFWKSSIEKPYQKKLDFLGFYHGKYCFRIYLSNADSEEWKKEWDVARGYFAYIEFSPENLSVYFTIADYTVYTK